MPPTGAALEKEGRRTAHNQPKLLDPPPRRPGAAPAGQEHTLKLAGSDVHIWPFRCDYTCFHAPVGVRVSTHARKSLDYPTSRNEVIVTATTLVRE